MLAGAIISAPRRDEAATGGNANGPCLASRRCEHRGDVAGAAGAAHGPEPADHRVNRINAIEVRVDAMLQLHALPKELTDDFFQRCGEVR
jgi:hypothetical protein